MAIEDTMAQMAHSQITQSLPSMTEDIQGFQIIDTNEEINSAIGVIVGLVGNMVVYIPAVYRRGKIYNMDIMYIPEIRQWLPTHDNWLTYIRSRRADLDAVIKDRDKVASKGKATNINLDEPLLQIVKTASAKLDDAYIKRVGIKTALSDAKDAIIAQLTNPVAELNIPGVPELIKKCASSTPAQNLVNVLANNTNVGDALVQFYTDDDLVDMSTEVVRALTVEPKVAPRNTKGTVKLLTSSSVEARDLSDEDKASILRDGAVISDTRGLKPTKIYKTRSNGAWVSPGNSGLYELLKLDGRTVTCYVVVGDRRPSYDRKQVSGINYVIPMDDGMARKAIEVPAHILGQPIPVTDINLSGGSSVQDLPSDKYICRLIVDVNGKALRLTARGARHFGDKDDYFVKLSSGTVSPVGQWTDKEWETRNADVTTIVQIPASGKLRIHGKTLYVPESAKLFDIKLDDELSDCCDICAMSIDETQPTRTRKLDLATFDEYIDAVQRRNKLISVKIYNDPTGYVVTPGDSNDTKPVEPLTKTAAAVRLVQDYAIRPVDAFSMLDEVKTNSAERYLLKLAAGTGYELMFSNQKPSDVEERTVDLTEESKVNTREAMAAEIERAGKSGVKEVMDVTVLRMLADDTSCVRLIQDMVPSLFTAMNTVGQLLFMLRAGTSMAEAYGDYRSDEMEKQFTSLMQRLGDAVIVLQQGKIGNVKDLLEGPLSDTLG